MLTYKFQMSCYNNALHHQTKILPAVVMLISVLIKRS